MATPSESARALSDPDTMLCVKAGVVDASFSCRKFRYDPLKRDPKRRTDGEDRIESLPFVEV